MGNVEQIAVSEYTDMKNNKHKVLHFMLSDERNSDKERVAEELYNALTRHGKRLPA